MYRTLVVAALSLAVVACGFYYFPESQLQQLAPGQTKQQFLARFSDTAYSRPVLRAAKSDSAGRLIEVITLMMADPYKEATEYWFVFKNGVLQQWGRPEDWTNAAATYDINFNPQPRVRAP